jgi:hypothetical protein
VSFVSFGEDRIISLGLGRRSAARPTCRGVSRPEQRHYQFLGSRHPPGGKTSHCALRSPIFLFTRRHSSYFPGSPKKMLNEADTCRKLVVPKLQEAGWDTDPHSIAEQRTFTDGRIFPLPNGSAKRGKPKRADYLLRYAGDFALAVVEAKVKYSAASDGLQQAKLYAEMLSLKFAYSTNGEEIVEFDFFTGSETVRPDFPPPDELWHRQRAGLGLADDGVAAQITALIITLLAGASAYPVLVTGQRAYKAIRSMADDTGAEALDEHMDRAEKTIGVFYFLAALAIAGLIVPIKWPKTSFPLSAVTLAVALICSGLAVYIAQVGGRVRHAEFRPSESPTPASESDHQSKE